MARPCGKPLALHVSLSPWGSLPAIWSDTVWLSGVVWDPGFVRSGARFAAVTVIDTNAVSDVATPSRTVNVKLSDAWNPAAGVYVSAGGVPESAPFVGPVTIANVSASP